MLGYDFAIHLAVRSKENAIDEDTIFPLYRLESEASLIDNKNAK
jgi:hypothetical protein